MTSSHLGAALLLMMLAAPNALFDVFDLRAVVPADTGVPRVASSPNQLPRPTTGVLSAWIAEDAQPTLTTAADDAVGDH